MVFLANVKICVLFKETQADTSVVRLGVMDPLVTVEGIYIGTASLESIVAYHSCDLICLLLAVSPRETLFRCTS